MSTPLDRFVAALRAHDCKPRRAGDGYSFCCPNHDDKKPSGSLNLGDGKVLLFCHVCGKGGTPGIVKAIGLEMCDLFPDDGHHRSNVQAKRIVKTYPYVDLTGEVLYEAVKYQPKDFRFRRPDKNGGWIWDLKGVHRILYRLPDLTCVPICHGRALAEGRSSTTVYVTEGEKDSDRLAREGLTATCCPGGAGKWKYLDDDSALEARCVVVLPHRDDAGRRHAEDVASRLNGRAASVRIVALPGVPEDGGDVSDWFDAGNDPEDLDRLASAAPEWEPAPDPSPQPYRDAAESMRAVNAIATTARDRRTAAGRLCDQVCEWFDRRGPEALAKDYPIPYAAAAVGVSRCHFHRLGQLGRVRRLLRARNTPDLDAIPDRALSPLTRLLDRPEDLRDAFAAAREAEGATAHEREQIRAAGGKAPRRRQLATFVREAVRRLLPESEPASPAGRIRPAEATTPAELCRQVARCLDAVIAMPAAPDDLRHAIEVAHGAAHSWAHHPPVAREPLLIGA